MRVNNQKAIERAERNTTEVGKARRGHDFDHVNVRVMPPATPSLTILSSTEHWQRGEAGHHDAFGICQTTNAVVEYCIGPR